MNISLQPLTDSFHLLRLKLDTPVKRFTVYPVFTIYKGYQRVSDKIGIRCPS
jgi:hypothetical protein